MVNRVVLGAFDSTFVLRASRPGFNVLTTTLTPEQIAFDSRWARAANIYASGVTRGTVGMGDMAGAIYATLQLPANLPYPPVVKALIRHDTRTTEFASAYIGAWPFTPNYEPGSGQYNFACNPPWSIPGMYNGMPWGYFYWYALRSD